MTFEYRRVSLNTTLKNARIFDDDSWEADEAFINSIKKEPVDSEDTNQTWLDNKPTTTQLGEDPWEFDNNAFSPIKQERIDFENKLKFDDNLISAPLREDPWEFDDNAFSPIKHERIDFEDKKLDSKDSKEHIAADIVSVQDSTKEKNLRKNLKRKSDVFIKREPETEESPSTPKKRLTSTSSKTSSPERKKFKDGQNRIKREMEIDPLVLQRRQKQIDYGKNTIGYDKYVQAIPRHKRTRTDPQTPDKYAKYSRRGFDGLIKQWRIKLHKYDPSDKIESVEDQL